MNAKRLLYRYILPQSRQKRTVIINHNSVFRPAIPHKYAAHHIGCALHHLLSDRLHVDRFTLHTFTQRTLGTVDNVAGQLTAGGVDIVAAGFTHDSGETILH